MTRSRTLLAIATLLFAIALVAAACDDSGDNNSDPAAEATAGGEGGGGDNTGGGDDDDHGDANGGDDSAGSTDNDELAALARQFAEATFRGEYTLTETSAGDPSEGNLVMVKDGNERLRFEVTAEQDGETVEIILIETPAGSNFCLRNAGEFGVLLGVPEGDGVCFASDPSGGEASGDFTDIINQIESAQWQVVDRSQREIAGEDADCYRTSDAEGALSDVCFSGDGYLLAATEPDGSGLEATSVGGDVSEADFETPYEVREFPAFDE